MFSTYIPVRYFSKPFSCSEQLFFREQDAWDLLQLGAADGLNDRSGPMEAWWRMGG